MRSMKKSSYISFDSGIAKQRELTHEDLRTVDQFIKNINSDVNQLFDVVQGNIRFAVGTNQRGENIFGYEVSNSNTGTADTEFSLSHSMSSNGIAITPTRFLVTYINKGGVIYDSGTAWTTSTVYFKCSAANANVKIFLLP